MDLIGAYSDSDSEEEQPEVEAEEPEVQKVKPKVRLPPPDLSTASTRADEVKKVIYRSQVEYLLSFSKNNCCVCRTPSLSATTIEKSKQRAKFWVNRRIFNKD